MDSDTANPQNGPLGPPVDDYLAEERGLLTILQEFVLLDPHKGHCVLRIHQRLYDYLFSWFRNRTDENSGPKNHNLVRLIALFIAFANPRTSFLTFYESDLAAILGVDVRTVQRYLAMCKNGFFNSMHADNLVSYINQKSGGTAPLKPVKYQLTLKTVFKGFERHPEASEGDRCVDFIFKYKGLVVERKIVDLRRRFNNCTNVRRMQRYGRQFGLQKVDKQADTMLIFEHFLNPIYEPGFDAAHTRYPVNWCLHPDRKAYFNKGRWYHGSIHGTTKGRHRQVYLEYKGLTHEIDMHNAMFYLMPSLFTDSVSKDDKAAYFEAVKRGTLYDDFIDFLCDKEKRRLTETKNSVIPLDGFDPRAKLPDRAEIKRKFQVYRNLEGEKKDWLKDVSEYMKNRFPTVHKWMRKQKSMQNRLAWIESDFISYVGEKLSAENIRFDWLHDAVYVSEADSARALEIWNSVRDEFEKAFM